MFVINTQNSRYLVTGDEISAEAGTTILDSAPHARLVTGLGHGLCDVVYAPLAGFFPPKVGKSFHAIVDGGPFTTSPVVSIENY